MQEIYESFQLTTLCIGKLKLENYRKLFIWRKQREREKKFPLRNKREETHLHTVVIKLYIRASSCLYKHAKGGPRYHTESTSCFSSWVFEPLNDVNE